MPTTQEVVSKFDQMEGTLGLEVLERQREIHCALNALISKRHFFMIGPPGTAKSYLIRRINDRIDHGTVEKIVGTDYQKIGVLNDEDNTPVLEPVHTYAPAYNDEAYFQWLLTKYTTPEEIYGPPSLPELRAGRYVRNTKRKLSRARVAFLDEIFKANSSILNALLTIMNERLFFNDGEDENVPLDTIFAASNEMPQDDGLHALWDRLHFRFSVKPMQEGGNFVRMLTTKRVAVPEKLMTWDDIRFAQEQIEEVKLPADIYEAMKNLKDSLYKEGIEPSERRFMDSIAIIQAEAFLDGRDTAEINDLRVLRHVMWSREEDQRTVERTVLELANPIDREAHDLLERIETLQSELMRAIKDADNHKEIAKQAVEIHGKLRKTKQRMDDLTRRVEESGRPSEILDIVHTKFVETAKTLMTDALKIDKDD